MDDLRDRVEAVERALTDGDGDLTALAEGAAAADRVAALEERVEAIEADLAELQAAAQALRGYVGNVRSVNESVEDRADSALATVESLEERVEALESDVNGGPGGHAGGEHDARTASDRRRRRVEANGRDHPPSEDGHRGDRDPDRKSEDPPTCRVCGRPEPERATDGGPSPESSTPREGRHDASDDEAADGPTSGRPPAVDGVASRETIRGFDPDGGVDRGALAGRRDRAPRPARPTTDRSTNGGLLQRLLAIL